jgi:hypothetical protein
LPIWPEPITPTFLIIAILLSTGTARMSRLPFPSIYKRTPAGVHPIRPVPQMLLSEFG